MTADLRFETKPKIILDFMNINEAAMLTNAGRSLKDGWEQFEI